MGRPLGSKKAKEIVETIPLGNTGETEQQIKVRIDKTFRVLDRLMDGILKNTLRGLIVAGAAGCGKTYAIETALQANLSPEDFHIHTGAMSEVELYKNLYKMRGRGQVFVADDCDSIYGSLNSLNLIKAATDPKRTARIISWGKNSWPLLASKNEGESIPTEFEYLGSAIFCTNMNLQAKIAQNTLLSKHYAAMIDRSPFLDLGIHTKKEILVRIWYVMEHTQFCEENEIPRQMGNTILSWIKSCLVEIQYPSIRTALKLAGYMKSYPDEEVWREMAETTLFNRQPH